jgi:hypothetical protein
MAAMQNIFSVKCFYCIDVDILKIMQLLLEPIYHNKEIYNIFA